MPGALGRVGSPDVGVRGAPFRPVPPEKGGTPRTLLHFGRFAFCDLQTLKRYPCRQCELSFHTPSSLRKHIRNNHDTVKKVYTCG